MTDPFAAPPGPGTGREGGPRRGRLSARRPVAPGRRDLVPAVVVLVLGVLLGGCWALLAPVVADRSAASGESRFAVDGTMAMLGLLAGVVTAGALAARPGRRPALRAVLVLVASAAASALAWGAGLVLGSPQLHAPGVLLVWPSVAALLLALGSLTVLLRSP